MDSPECWTYRISERCARCSRRGLSSRTSACRGRARVTVSAPAWRVRYSTTACFQLGRSSSMGFRCCRAATAERRMHCARSSSSTKVNSAARNRERIALHLERRFRRDRDPGVVTQRSVFLPRHGFSRRPRTADGSSSRPLLESPPADALKPDLADGGRFNARRGRVVGRTSESCRFSGVLCQRRSSAGSGDDSARLGSSS